MQVFKFNKLIAVLLLSIPIAVFSDEKIEQSKFFVENLGKEVVEKVSNVNLTESQINLNMICQNIFFCNNLN